MNKLLRFFFLCLVVIALAECKSTSHATSSKAPPAVPPKVSEAKPADAVPSPADVIASGQMVYQAKCYQCHELPRTADYNKSEWHSIMDKMAHKAHLSELEKTEVLAFIDTNAKP